LGIVLISENRLLLPKSMRGFNLIQGEAHVESNR
jgi:hypothetical protein